VEPEGLIPPDTLEMVLYDMMVLETYTKIKHKNVNDFYILMKRSAQPILESYHVDSTRYMVSMKYYSRNQEILMSIYSRILEKVEAQKSEVDTLVVNQ
jgi:hypothetical protein